MSQEQQAMVPDESSPEIRRVWYEEEWWYAVVDFIRLWTESNDPARYWRNMKLRADPELKQFLKEHLRTFPLKAADHRMREIETANQESLLRIVQSVPSKNAEKVKLLLARWGTEKLEELQQEPSPIEIARAKYRKDGYDDTWIEARIGELLARNEITATWKERGADEVDYAVLTNTLTEMTFGLKVKSYKLYKRITSSTNLQDNMTLEELAFSILSKTTARTYHEDRDSQGYQELHRDVYDAGKVTGRARELIEQETGRPVVSSKNAKDLKQLPEKKPKRLPPPEQGRLL